MLKFFSTGLFFIIFLIAGCNKNDVQTNNIVINVMSPTKNEKIMNVSKTDIHFFVEAEEEIHKVEIKVSEVKNPDNVVLNFSTFVHRKTFEFREFIDLSAFIQGTEFSLTVKACKDHDCESSENIQLPFTL
jgi:hypothetical protein